LTKRANRLTLTLDDVDEKWISDNPGSQLLSKAKKCPAGGSWASQTKKEKIEN